MQTYSFLKTSVFTFLLYCFVLLFACAWNSTRVFVMHCVNASACLMRAITQWASDTPEFNSILKPPVRSHCCREDTLSIHTH